MRGVEEPAQGLLTNVAGAPGDVVVREPAEVVSGIADAVLPIRVVLLLFLRPVGAEVGRGRGEVALRGLTVVTGPRPMMGYALRHENGAYCPLFLPLESSHVKPSAWT